MIYLIIFNAINQFIFIFEYKILFKYIFLDKTVEFYFI